LAHKVKINSAGFACLGIDIRSKSSPIMKTILYKVDTGANCTTISHTNLLKLGYDRDWIMSGKLLEGKACPTLASGVVISDCYQVILPEIRIGEWVGYNWPFTTSLSVPFRLLLGTDSMRFFNWQFNYENKVCSFELIPEERKLLFNQQEQSIHAVDDESK